MNWKVWLAVGAAAGGAFWAARRRARRSSDADGPWADATDTVTRFS